MQNSVDTLPNNRIRSESLPVSMNRVFALVLLSSAVALRLFWMSDLSFGDLSAVWWWAYPIAIQLGVQTPVELALYQSILLTLISVVAISSWEKQLSSVFEGQSAHWVWTIFFCPCFFFASRSVGDGSWVATAALVFWVSCLKFMSHPKWHRLLLPLLSFGFLVSSAYSPHSTSSDVASHPWDLQGAWFALTAPRYLGAADVALLLGRDWFRVPFFSTFTQEMVRVAVAVSMLGTVFFLVGLATALRPRRTLSTAVRRSNVMALAVGAGFFVCSAWNGWGASVFGAESIPLSPLYYWNFVWPAIFHLVWRGFCFFQHQLPSFTGPMGRLVRVLPLAYVFASLLVLVAAQVRIHEGRGTRSLHYGPTLGNLWGVSNGLMALQGAQVVRATRHTKSVPDALDHLEAWRALCGQGSGTDSERRSRSSEKWLLTYRNTKETWSGELALSPILEGPATLKTRTK